ncbi:uncharacterized protein LOC131952074 [Physella acuta]|uniref:uncharacterized protein LOC131952074 n=1 Tax=Physella acuta TaxID=109671 RepID=UPI0027DD39A4|nr:uncharacterized protein LOC131952074 [Physella acuta]
MCRLMKKCLTFTLTACIVLAETDVECANQVLCILKKYCVSVPGPLILDMIHVDGYCADIKDVKTCMGLCMNEKCPDNRYEHFFMQMFGREVENLYEVLCGEHGEKVITGLSNCMQVLFKKDENLESLQSTCLKRATGECLESDQSRRLSCRFVKLIECIKKGSQTVCGELSADFLGKDFALHLFTRLY